MVWNPCFLSCSYSSRLILKFLQNDFRVKRSKKTRCWEFFCVSSRKQPAQQTQTPRKLARKNNRDNREAFVSFVKINQSTSEDFESNQSTQSILQFEPQIVPWCSSTHPPRLQIPFRACTRRVLSTKSLLKCKMSRYARPPNTSLFIRNVHPDTR